MYLGECMVAIQNDWQSFRVLLLIAQLPQLPTSTSNLLSINCVQYHASSTIPACFRSCIRVSYSSTSLPACRAKTLPWSPSVHIIVIEPPKKWSCLQNPRRLSQNWAPLKSQGGFLITISWPSWPLPSARSLKGFREPSAEQNAEDERTTTVALGGKNMVVHDIWEGIYIWCQYFVSRCLKSISMGSLGFGSCKRYRHF